MEKMNELDKKTLALLSQRNPAQARAIRKQYMWQKNKASRRGIPWQFNFASWLIFWIDSGHFYDRGRKGNQYCMARLGDTGPYSAQNCVAITQIQNLKDRAIYRRAGVSK